MNEQGHYLVKIWKHNNKLAYRRVLATSPEEALRQAKKEFGHLGQVVAVFPF